MILSASRRTDIPACHSRWFFERLREGFVFTANPMNLRQISKVDLSPEAVDGIVFWSKNPRPMLDQLEPLGEYAFYFQFTLNAYDRDIETGLPPKAELLDTFKRLSDKIGPEKTLWRYDPVLLDGRRTTAWHVENFGKLAAALKGYTEKVTFSFIDLYRKIARAVRRLDIKAPTDEDQILLAGEFSRMAKENRLRIESCAEAVDLSACGVARARCIDDRLLSRISGRPLAVEKDKNQRPECLCVKSKDIGAYNSCSNGCVYCYANARRADGPR
jgi:DNA repair photolyase